MFISPVRILYLHQKTRKPLVNVPIECPFKRKPLFQMGRYPQFVSVVLFTVLPM